MNVLSDERIEAIEKDLAAGDEAVRKHVVGLGELLLEAREHWGPDEHSWELFFKWVEREFRLRDREKVMRWMLAAKPARQ